MREILNETFSAPIFRLSSACQRVCASVSVSVSVFESAHSNNIIIPFINDICILFAAFIEHLSILPASRSLTTYIINCNNE